MRKVKVIQKIAIIIFIMMLSVSCSSKVSTEVPNKVLTETTNKVSTEVNNKTPIEETIKAPEETTKVPVQETVKVPEEVTKAPIEKAIENWQVSWENYINKIVINGELKLLYTQKNSEINLKEYLKQGKISIDKSYSKIDQLDNLNCMSYLIDIDKDGLDELCLVQCEGSIRYYYVDVFKKKNGVYVYESTTDRYIYPIKYNNEVHFISIESDFKTKVTSAIIEYEVKGLTFKQKRIFDISYTYDISKLPKSITSIIDNKYLNSLNTYKISDSNIAKIEKINELSYDIELVDSKNNNLYGFIIKLWETTVGYAPNEWKIESKDDLTHKFKGIEQIETETDINKESVCFGVKFYKDKDGNIFLLKTSYLFFTVKDHKEGDLVLQLFKFNKDSVEEVEKRIIEPKIEIKVVLSKN